MPLSAKISVFCLLVFSLFGCESKVSPKTEETVVKKGDLVRSISLSGNILPERRTIITAPFNGYVKRLYVQTGDKVSVNDPLVSITQSLQSKEPVFPIRAPFPGTVVQILIKEGEFVKEADSEVYLLRVDNLKNLYVDALISESDRDQISVGQVARLKALAVVNQSYRGEVTVVDLASRKRDQWRGAAKVVFRVRIKILDPDKRLKPGMSIVADIETSRKEGVLVLPHQFVLQRGSRHFVFPPSGAPIEVQVGDRNDLLTEIKSGLKEGDRVTQIDYMKLASEQN